MRTHPPIMLFDPSAPTARQAQLRLRNVLLRMLLVGCVLVLVVPAARGRSELLGWLPLWLIGMPASALWAQLRFRLPEWPQRLRARSRPARPQARRRRNPPMRLPRAA